MSGKRYWQSKIGLTSLALAALIALVPPLAFWTMRYAGQTDRAELLLQSGLLAGVSSLLAWFAIALLKQGADTLTDELVAEQKLQNLRFGTAINKMSQGLCFFDGQQRLIVCNEQYGRMYMLSPELVQPGTTLREIVDHRFASGCSPKMTHAAYLRWRDEIAVSNEPSDTVVELSDGRTIAIHHEPMPDNGWVATHDDISMLENAKSELRGLNANLEQRVGERTAALEASNRDLETFAYSIAHDFRAPLRAMDAYAALLLEENQQRLDEQGREYLQRIRASSVRLGKLTDDILNLAQVAKQEIKRVQVDMSALAEQSIAALHRREPHRTFVARVAPDLTASGDSRLLAALMAELLNNAWKFTAPKPTARIEVGTRAIDGRFAYFVRDDGVGFDMAYAGKLFQPFARLHALEAFPGTGIGLALSKVIVDRHGGRIWAEAKPDAGACFYFSLGS